MLYLLAAVAGAAAGFGLASWKFRRDLRAQSGRDRDEARQERDRQQAALMGTIASGLAHEIRNPLSTVSMNLQLLREDWEGPVSEREQRSVRKIDTILKEVRRLENILNDFLRFAAGHKLRPERVNLNALADELLDFATPEADRARVRIARSFAPDLPPVQADANLIRQALLNLVLNAIQAMPDGGRLDVRTEAAPGAARVVVGDTGVGIPPEHLGQIFNLYFSTKPAGTGLGLPMARKIVEEHRGTLEVRSEPGRGSAFTLSLPTLDAAPPPPEDGAR